jgi:hypothetical protein
VATRAGVGISRHHNPSIAGREAAEQALENAGIVKPDYVFMFGSIGYDQRSLVRVVRQTTGGVGEIGPVEEHNLRHLYTSVVLAPS